MDVMNVEQAKIAEEAGACAVMALERIPANIRRDGGVARMVSITVCFDTDLRLCVLSPLKPLLSLNPVSLDGLYPSIGR